MLRFCLYGRLGCRRKISRSTKILGEKSAGAAGALLAGGLMSKLILPMLLLEFGELIILFGELIRFVIHLSRVELIGQSRNISSQRCRIGICIRTLPLSALMLCRTPGVRLCW